jgi:uncharacterized membrane-anchored protein
LHRRRRRSRRAGSVRLRRRRLLTLRAHSPRKALPRSKPAVSTQRVLVETYRMMALLGLPLARQVSPQLAAWSESWASPKR